jgi:5-methylthioadenosine/S-adenosylhomocysteine deaminase
MSKTLLADAEFVIQDAHTVLSRASVLIEDGIIKQVARASQLDDTSEATETIDCRGLMLLPGLVNSHTHLYQVLTRGIGKSTTVRDWAREVTYPRARTLSAEEYYDAVLLACADAIRNGSTAVVDHPTHYARFYANESYSAIAASGLRGAVVRGGANISIIDPNEVRPLDEDLAETSAFVRRWGTKGRVQAWIGPAGFHNCSPEGLRQFKALAERLDTRFHFHLAESPLSQKEALNAGFPGETSHALALGLLNENTSVAHAIWLTNDEIKLVATSGSQVVHCPTSNQILASGIAKIPQMLKCGVSVALATDGASSNDSQDMVAELKSAALIHRVSALDPTVIGAEDVFRAATEGGAQVLGINRLGRLVEGYIADVIGIEMAGNPSLTPCTDPVAAVVYYASGRDVCLTVVQGRILYRDRSFTTIDVNSTIDRVNRAVAEHRERLSES